MPKHHFQVQGTEHIDPYANMLDTVPATSIADTPEHWISIRNHGTGTVEVFLPDGANPENAPESGGMVTTDGQLDLTCPPGVRYDFRSADGDPCSDVYVIMVPSS
jgi:hypothetical protein